MLKHQGIYLPDGETHLTDWMTQAGELVDGKGTYQIKKLRAAVALCKQFRTAIDIGGHCGLWSMQLAKQFKHVHAFEPVSAHRECFVKNLENVANVTLHACALGKAAGSISIRTAPTSSGDSWVSGTGNIPMKRLDSFGIFNADLIKLDVEGGELFALQGGEETLLKNKPVVIVEQKPGHASQHFGIADTAAVDYLRDLGYRLVKEMSGDFIMVWGK